MAKKFRDLAEFKIVVEGEREDIGVRDRELARRLLRSGATRERRRSQKPCKEACHWHRVERLRATDATP